jgi:hypothetical protein
MFTRSNYDRRDVYLCHPKLGATGLEQLACWSGEYLARVANAVAAAV